MNVLWALIRKDWRVVKPVVIVAFVVLVLPVTIQGLINASKPALGQAMSTWTNEQWLQYANSRDMYLAMLAIGLAGWCIVCPALGGVMFARERRDRSAELVELMPVSRGVRLTSKLAVLACVVSLAALMVFIAWQIGATFFFVETTWNPLTRNVQMMSTLPFIAVTLGAIGVSWLLSAVLSSEVLATAITFGFFAVSALLLNVVPGPGNHRSLYLWLDGMTPRPDFGYAGLGMFAIAGAIGLLAGCVVTLRRREV